mmetsp:Transcript_14136/g.57502  ORF Transcript_14136/g.57502 Transcript_14136/m.57502 type:complete len:260 (-) Transcript_14136:50-829(-)
MMSAPSLGALTMAPSSIESSAAPRTRAPLECESSPLAAPSRSPTLATVTIRRTPTLVRKSNVSSIDEVPSGSSSPRSGMCTNTDAPESVSTCVVSALVWFRAMGTAIAPHIHVAFIATSNSGPGIADMATLAPLSASAGGGSCAITSSPAAPSRPSSRIVAKVARMESASASACARSVPYVTSTPRGDTTATSAGRSVATSASLSPRESNEYRAGESAPRDPPDETHRARLGRTAVDAPNDARRRAVTASIAGNISSGG